SAETRPRAAVCPRRVSDSRTAPRLPRETWAIPRGTRAPLPAENAWTGLELPALGGDVVDHALLGPELAGVDVHGDGAAGGDRVRSFGAGEVHAHRFRPAVGGAEAAPGVGEVADGRARDVRFQPLHALVGGAGGRHGAARRHLAVEAMVGVTIGRAAGEDLPATAAGRLDGEGLFPVADEVVVTGADRAGGDEVAGGGRAPFAQRAPDDGGPDHAEGGVGRVEIVDGD